MKNFKPLSNLKNDISLKNDIKLLIFAFLIGVVIPFLVFKNISAEKYEQQELRDNINKKVVITKSQKNEDRIQLTLKNTLNDNIKNINLKCQTTVLSGDVINTYASIFDKMSANETKSITVTQLIYGWDNVPVDIRQVASITCKVVDMVSQDGRSLYK